MFRRPKRIREQAGIDAEPVAIYSWRQLLYAVVIALAAAFLLPQPSSFPYTYEIGQPWGYRDLKAPFDFEVLRPESEIKEELDKIKSDQRLYLQFNSQVARQQKRAFSEMLDEQLRISKNDVRYEDLHRNAASYRSFGQNLLDHLYNRGIYDEQAPVFSRRSRSSEAILISENEEKQTRLGALFSVAAAQEFLTDTLPYSPLREPELLLPMLERRIAANVQYSDSLTQAYQQQKIAALFSTGIAVRKGELIVREDELISSATYQKLQSLAGRYAVPPAWQVIPGYFIIALIGFIALGFIWLLQEPLQVPGREIRLLLPVIILAVVAMVSFASWIGAAVALLIPLYAIVIALQRLYPAPVRRAAWVLAVLLPAIALDWGTGWIIIQASGLLGAELFLQYRAEWNARLRAAAGVAVLQITAGYGAGLAGLLPDSVWTVESLPFILLAAGISLPAFPLRDQNF
jgi:membrane-associated HD superfamily phosphohydrolase